MRRRTFLVLTFFVSAAALVTHAQSVSLDDSSITPQSGGSLVTADGTWTFGQDCQNGYGNAVLLNGSQSGGACGTLIYVSSGTLYLNNLKGEWWTWNGSWSQTSDPRPVNSCTNYYTSSVATPSGYGASYDLFSTRHELEVSVDCSGASPKLTVGSNQSNQYIYSKGYMYQSGAWQAINLTGTGLVSNAWYP
jgi:hypothetical protein